MATFTLEEVQKHTQPDDVWIVFHNKVYDVTKYLEDHPGGKAVLLEVAGTNATEAFEDAGHSDEAREQMEPFCIGSLPSEEHTETVEVYRPNFEKVSQSAAVDVKREKKSALSSTVRVVKYGLFGIAGTLAVTAYRNGWTVNQFLRALPSMLTVPLPKGSAVQGTTSGQFWTGATLATLAQFSVTLGVGFWASHKLDVQQEFTHYAPRRRTQPAYMGTVPRSGPVVKPKPKVLDPRQWRQFVLTKKEEVAPNVYFIVFGLPRSDDVLGLPTGQHIALRASINGQMVSRSYTPVSNNTDLGRIELLIKVYPNGAMTKHLEGMKVGETIEIRGPKGAMQYSRQYAQHIGMIAGGTGITPMYQLIRAICEDPGDKTKISLLYANNTEDDILLHKELDGFARSCPEKFQMWHVLARPQESWEGYRGFVSGDLISTHLAPAAESNKMLLCGPPPMLAAMKKTLEGMGWTMPGAMAKATDQVFLF